MANDTSQATLPAFSPTAEQALVADHMDGPALVVSGAGSGKTATICERISRMIQKGVAPESIMLLTFTNAAAHDMEDRIAKTIGDDPASRITSGTFHRVGIQMLRQWGVELPGGSTLRNFGILGTNENNDAHKHVRGQFTGARDRKWLTKIKFPTATKLAEIDSEMHNRVLSLEDVMRMSKYADIASTTMLELVRAYLAEYDAYKMDPEENGRGVVLLSFDDIIDQFIRLVDTRPLSMAGYSYVIVDEAQDMNVAQSMLLQSMAEAMGADNVMLVGDAAQSIYGWRGSDVSLFDNFPHDHHGTTVYTLSKNFRSTQSILDVANSVLEGANINMTTSLSATRTFSRPSFLIGVRDEAAQTEQVMVNIRAVLKKRLGTIAVMSMRSSPLRILEGMLRKEEISYVMQGGPKFSELEDVRNVIAMFRLTFENYDQLATERALRMYHNVGERIATNVTSEGPGCLLQNQYLNRTGTYAAAVQKACKGIGDYLECALELDWPQLATFTTSVYLQILRETHADRLAERQKQTDDIDDFKETLDRAYEGAEATMGLLLEMIRQIGAQSAQDFVDVFTLEVPVVDDHPDVTLTTIHSAKGLEWDNVILLDVTDSTFPGRPAPHMSPEDAEAVAEEARRCLYVAVTRPRNRLLMIWPHTKRGFGRQGRFEPQNLTRYLQGAERSCDDMRVV